MDTLAGDSHKDIRNMVLPVQRYYCFTADENKEFKMFMSIMSCMHTNVFSELSSVSENGHNSLFLRGAEMKQRIGSLGYQEAFDVKMTAESESSLKLGDFMEDETMMDGETKLPEAQDSMGSGVDDGNDNIQAKITENSTSSSSDTTASNDSTAVVFDEAITPRGLDDDWDIVPSNLPLADFSGGQTVGRFPGAVN